MKTQTAGWRYALVAFIGGIVLTGCAAGPQDLDSWAEYIPEVQDDLSRLEEQTVVLADSDYGFREVELQAETTYLLFAARDDYEEVEASSCELAADPGVEVSAVPRSEWNYPYESRTYFTFAAFTTGDAITTTVECDPEWAAVVALPADALG